jgi:hypothetical protein
MSKNRPKRRAPSGQAETKLIPLSELLIYMRDRAGKINNLRAQVPNILLSSAEGARILTDRPGVDWKKAVRARGFIEFADQILKGAIELLNFKVGLLGLDFRSLADRSEQELSALSSHLAAQLAHSSNSQKGLQFTMNQYLRVVDDFILQAEALINTSH